MLPLLPSRSVSAHSHCQRKCHNSECPLGAVCHSTEESSLGEHYRLQKPGIQRGGKYMSALQNSGYMTQGHTEASGRARSFLCSGPNRRRDTESSPKLEKAPDENPNTQPKVALRKKSTSTSTAHKQQQLLIYYGKSMARNSHPHLWSCSQTLRDEMWRDEMKGLASALQPRGEDEQSLRSKSEQTSSKKKLLPLFGLWFWCFTLEEQGTRPWIIPPSELPEQFWGCSSG